MPDAMLAELLALAGRAAPAPGEVEIAGRDPILRTPFAVGEAAAAALAACGVLVCDLHEQRTGRRQRVRVAVADAAASLLSFAFQRLDGAPVPRPALANPTVAFYRARDGRFVHLHGGFPHLRDGTLRLLGCADERAAVAAAVARFDAAALEDALAEAGLCGAMLRSAAEWAAHPQGRALAGRPPVEVIRIGDAPPEPPPPGARPLAGVRVLDLTRVLAGPTCARTLAEHGAEVLKISSPRLPSIQPFVIDTGHGKRAAHLDLDRAADAARLHALAREASVFAQGYRSGALERRGLGPEALAAARPGLIYVSMNAYGHEGPWRRRPGWEQLAQTVTGLAAEQGGPDGPELIPAAACDYTTGYLAAFGTLVALARRAREGGSWHVRASLCQTGSWLYGLRARLGAGAAARPRGLDFAAQSARLLETDSEFGRLRYLPPALQLSETPARYALPPAPLGSHAPAFATPPAA